MLDDVGFADIPEGNFCFLPFGTKVSIEDLSDYRGGRRVGDIPLGLIFAYRPDLRYPYPYRMFCVSMMLFCQ